MDEIVSENKAFVALDVRIFSRRRAILGLMLQFACPGIHHLEHASNTICRKSEPFFKVRVSAIDILLPEIVNHHWIKQIAIVQIFIQVIVNFLTISCMHHNIEVVWHLNDRANMALLRTFIYIIQDCLVRCCKERWDWLPLVMDFPLIPYVLHRVQAVEEELAADGASRLECGHWENFVRVQIWAEKVLA